MKVVEVDLKEQLTTTFFDPSPHRLDPESPPVSERRIPLVYSCENCGDEIYFKTSSFEKHCNSNFTNLKEEDNEIFKPFIKENNFEEFSFLDFYCPKCKQATKIIYLGGPSGYWGEFFFEIRKVLALKNNEKNGE